MLTNRPLLMYNMYTMKKITRDENHVYTTPLGKLPSVTTILGVLAKPALVPWAVKVTCDYIANNLDKGSPTEVVKMARKESIGSAVHDLVEKWAKDNIYYLEA
jgi:predicted thioesterase